MKLDWMTIGLEKEIYLFIDRDFPKDGYKDKYQYSNDLFNNGADQWLQKIYIQGKFQHLSFIAGDFYESMNRGLMLSMKKDSVYGDNSVRGGNFSFNYEGFHSKLFGGVANPLLRDEVTEKRMQKASDILWGGEAGFKFLKYFDLSIQYTGAIYDKYKVDGYDSDIDVIDDYSTYLEKNYHIIGSSLNVGSLWKGFSVYMGGSFIVNGENSETVPGKRPGMPPETTEKDIKNGSALYLSLNQYVDFGKNRLFLLLEGKRYDAYYLNYDYMEDSSLIPRRYFSPPSLLWKEFPISNEFDTWGIRTKISFSDKSFSGIKVSGEYVYADSLDDSEKQFATYYNEKINFAGFTIERRWDSFFMEAKQGWLNTTYSLLGSDTEREWWYTKFQSGLNINKFAIKGTLDYYNKYDEPIHMYNGHDLTAVIDLAWDNSYTLSLVGNYYEEGTVPDGKTANPDEPDKFYGGVYLGYKYKTLNLTMFYGKNKGGLVCTGGLCRYVPEFKGFKFELSYRY